MSKGPESGRRRAPARIVIALATAALAGLAAPLIARASSPTVALNVALEYAASGAVSSSTWTPVQVTLTNSGPDFGGTVEISVTGSPNGQRCVGVGKATYCGGGGSTASYLDRIPVQLAAGTTKRYVIDVASSTYPLHARLLDASGNVVTQDSRVINLLLQRGRSRMRSRWSATILPPSTRWPESASLTGSSRQ